MTKTPSPTADSATVSINVPLPADLHRRLKIRAITDDTSLRDAVIAAIEQYVSG